MKNNFFFSIIIPCYNCENTIKMCINSILHQDYTNFEIILVNDMSTDTTQSILLHYAQQYSCIRLITLQDKGFAGGARNVGKENALGNIIVFIDADVVLSNRYLSLLYKTYYDYPRADGIAGSVINPYNTVLSNANLFSSMSNQLPLGRIKEITIAPTINISFKKEIIEDVYFLERNTATEDILFTHFISKKGGKLLFNPALHVYHYHSRLNLKAVIQREKFYARGFVMSRRLYALKGSFLLKRKYLFLLLPRFFLLLKRILPTKYIFKFIAAMPFIIYLEIIRTIEIFKEDNRFIKTLSENKKNYKYLTETRLAYRENVNLTSQ